MTRQLSAEPTIKLDNDAKWSSDTALILRCTNVCFGLISSCNNLELVYRIPYMCPAEFGSPQWLNFESITLVNQINVSRDLAHFQLKIQSVPALILT